MLRQWTFEQLLEVGSSRLCMHALLFEFKMHWQTSCFLVACCAQQASMLAVEVRYSGFSVELKTCLVSSILVNPTLWHSSCVCSADLSVLGFLIQQPDDY